MLPYWKGKTIAELLAKGFKDSGIYPGEWGDFIENLPRTTGQTDMVTSAGSAIGVWQGHLILDHEKPIKEGLIAMQKEVQDEIISRTEHTRV